MTEWSGTQIKVSRRIAKKKELTTVITRVR